MSLYGKFCDTFFGDCIHEMPGSQSVYLTFDDGPDPLTTPGVLDCLARHKAKATFFIIAEKAKKEIALTKRILSEGHALGNHSLDHRYKKFFFNKKSIGQWIKASEEIFRCLGIDTVAFRSPAGVRTPALHSALRELKIPLVHWNIRFFDSTHPWTQEKAQRALDKITPGSIVLLHDSQKKINREIFLGTLDFFLEGLNKKSIPLESLQSVKPIPKKR